MLKRNYLVILFMSTVLLTLACLTSSALAAAKVGDLNGDGYIDSIDYRFMNRYILSKINDFPVEDNLWVGDINKDDSIDTLDFAFLRKHLIGSVEINEPIKLQMANVEGKTGDIVSLPLLLKNIPEDGIDELKFKLKFDNEALEAIGVDSNYPRFSSDIDNEVGEIIFDNGSYYDSVSGDCVYSYIDFKILSEVSQFSTINYEIEYFKDENDNSYNVSTIEGGVDIKGTETQLIVGEKLALPGENVTIPIKLENIPEEGIDNISFDLDFDNTMISVLDIRSGEIVPVATDLISEINSNDGNMSLSFVNYYEETSNITENGVFAYLDVQVDGYEETGFSKISIDNISADELDEPIFDVESFNKIAGGVHVTEESLAVEIDSIDNPEDPEITVPVRLKDITGSGISEFQFKINYDTELLIAENVKLADIEEPLLNKFYKEQINNEEGYVKFKFDNEYALSLSEDFSIKDDSIIAYLHFRIQSKKHEYTPLELDIDYFSGEQEQYKVDAINGGIDMGNIEDPFLIEVDNKTGKPGDILSIPIYLKGVPENEINAGDFWLSFNTEALEVVDIEAGEIVPSPETNFDRHIDNEEGFVSFLFLDYCCMANEPIKGDGIFAYVNFKIKEDTSPGIYTIDLLKVGAFADYNLNIISVGFIEGSIVVTNPDNSVTLRTDNVEAETYDTVTVSIMLEDIPADGLDNVEFEMNYNNNALRVFDIRPGDINSSLFNYDITRDYERINFMYSSNSINSNDDAIMSDGIFAYVDFKVISQEDIFVNLQTEFKNATDINDNYYAADTVDGGVDINGVEEPLEIKLGSGLAYPTEIVSIPVSLENVPDRGVNICDFKVDYYGYRFEVVDVRTGEIVQDSGMITSKIDNEDGIVSVLFKNDKTEEDNIYEDGNIVYIDFRVKEYTGVNLYPIKIIEDSKYINPEDDLSYVNLDTSNSAGEIEVLKKPLTLCLGKAETNNTGKTTVPILVQDIPEEGIYKLEFKLTHDAVYVFDVRPGEVFKEGFDYEISTMYETSISFNYRSESNNVNNIEESSVFAYIDFDSNGTKYTEFDFSYYDSSNIYEIKTIDGVVDIEGSRQN